MSDTNIDERFERAFLSNIPRDVVESLSETQMAAIKLAYGTNKWGGHRVDARGKVRWLEPHWYYVLVAGPDKRTEARSSPGGKEGATLRFIVVVVGGFVVLQVALILALVKIFF